MTTTKTTATNKALPVFWTITITVNKTITLSKTFHVTFVITISLTFTSTETTISTITININVTSTKTTTNTKKTLTITLTKGLITEKAIPPATKQTETLTIIITLTKASKPIHSNLMDVIRSL